MSDADITLWRRFKSQPKAESGQNGNGTPVLPCDPKALDFGKPVLLCLGGIETTTSKQANGFAKRIIGLAGGDAIFDRGAQVLTAEYSPIEDLAEAARATNGDGAALLDVLGNHLNDFTTDVFPTHQIQKELGPKALTCAGYLIDALFNRTDVIADLNGLDGDARREALGRSMHALGQITIASYSFGSYITPFLHEKMRMLMKERGFTEEEGKQARHEVQVVSFGDVGIWFRNTEDMTSTPEGRRPPWDFTSVHIVSLRDKAVQKFAGITPEVAGEGAKRDRLITFGNGRADTVALLLSRLPEEITDAPEVIKLNERIARGEDPAQRALTAYKRHWTGHAVPDYTGTSQQQPESRIAPYFSLEGGQWFIPSALATALHHCLETSCAGTRRHDALAMLAPVAEKDVSGKDFASVPAEQTPLPGNPGYYPYQDRMAELIETRIRAQRLPPRQTESWVTLLQENGRSAGDAARLSSDFHPGS